jgi:hypothetical protein
MTSDSSRAELHYSLERWIIDATMNLTGRQNDTPYEYGSCETISTGRISRREPARAPRSPSGSIASL